MATELVAVRFKNVTYSTTSKITSYKPHGPGDLGRPHRRWTNQYLQTQRAVVSRTAAEKEDSFSVPFYCFRDILTKVTGYFVTLDLENLQIDMEQSLYRGTFGQYYNYRTHLLVTNSNDRCFASKVIQRNIIHSGQWRVFSTVADNYIVRVPCLQQCSLIRFI